VNNQVKAHLALLGANLFYGAGFTVAKQVMPRLIEPLGFIFIRVSVVLVLFWLSFGFGKKFRAKIEKRDWKILVLGGLFGVALNQMLFFMGLNLTFPIHASLIMMSTPLLITVIALFVLRERITLDKALGLALGIGGASFLMSAGKEITLTGNSAFGDLLIFLNAASYAVYLVMIKPLMVRYRPIIVIRWVFLFGFLFMFPFGIQDFLNIDWSLFTPSDYGAVLFIVICVTFFTFLWNIYALKHLSPSIAGGYIYLQPIFAAFISVIVTGEALTWVKVLSTLLIFSGVYLVNFGWKPPKQKIKSV
jgi:drug/metabolite transporter (DMT)-like permease